MFIIKLAINIILWCFGLVFKLVKSIIGHSVFLGSFLVISILVGVLFNKYISNPITLIRPHTVVSFDVPAIDGGRFMSNSLRGRFYGLFFTHTECDKCTLQLDQLAKLRANGLEIYPVFSEDDLTIQKKLSLYGPVSTRIIIDKQRSLNRMAYAYIVPHLAIINESGEIVMDITGKISNREIKRVAKLMGQTTDEKPTDEKAPPSNQKSQDQNDDTERLPPQTD